MSTPTLTIENLCVNLAAEKLLDNISLTLNAGKVLGILGPNGAGKSTLLTSIMAEHTPAKTQSGKITLCNQMLPLWSSSARAKQVAMLPQMSGLQFAFTVKEVVQLARIPHNSGKQADAEIVQEALIALDIQQLENRLYTDLSGGEKQRVHLARVMAQIWREGDAGQRLLLLDEPTSSLDLGHQQQLMTAIREFANQGVAVILVAHDINLVASIADHMLALSRGQVIAQGTTEDVINAEVLHALYGVNVHVIEHPVTGKRVVI